MQPRTKLCIGIAFLMLLLSQLACDTNEISGYPQPNQLGQGWVCPAGQYVSNVDYNGMVVCRTKR